MTYYGHKTDQHNVNYLPAKECLLLVQSFPRRTPCTRVTRHCLTSPRLGMIFGTFSVKARWGRWCRWNCDLRAINVRKKAFSVVPKVSPRHPNHVTICLLRHSGESLQNGQLELRRRNWYFSRETHKDTAVSVWACRAGFWKSTGTSRQLRSKTHMVFQLMHCYTWGHLRIVTVCGNTVGRHS